LVGTFALVFVGTGAIIVNDVSGGALTHLGVSMAFGLVVMTMVYAVGDISGAHLNPAVTLGFWVARRLPTVQLAPYVLSQCLGAVLASASLRWLFMEHATLGATMPVGAVHQSCALEVVLTFFLVFVILGVTTGPKDKGISAGVAIGATVALGALLGGPISGASMNPARSLGPALLTGQMSMLWLYVLAPFAGALLAVGGCRCVREPGCCSAGARASG